ncbi:MAG: ABC transporter permease, partial [Burkholderiaceae bacterium]
MSPSLSPSQRAWLRFKRNRRGTMSLWLFVVAFSVSLLADVLSNDRPLIVHYDNRYYFPLVE